MRDFDDTESGRFARRLWKAMDDAGWPQRGRIARWQRRFKAPQATAWGWVSGSQQPRAEIAMQMALDLDVPFDLLYYGSASEGVPPHPSNSDIPRTLSERELKLLELLRSLPDEKQGMLERIAQAMSDELNVPPSRKNGK